MEEERKAANFIEAEINKDIANDVLVVRQNEHDFRRNRMDTFTSGM